MTEAATPEPEAQGSRPVYLDVTGMTCVMCSRRVEKALNKIEGVKASVNLATKTATVEAAGHVGVDELCAAVVKAGYGAEPRATAPDVTPAAPGPVQRLIDGVFGRSAAK